MGCGQIPSGHVHLNGSVLGRIRTRWSDPVYPIVEGYLPSFWNQRNVRPLTIAQLIVFTFEVLMMFTGSAEGWEGIVLVQTHVSIAISEV